MADIQRDGRDDACHDNVDDEGEEDDIQPDVPDRWRRAKAVQLPKEEHEGIVNAEDDEDASAAQSAAAAARIQLGGWAADQCDDNDASCDDRPDEADGEAEADGDDIRA